MNTTDHIPARRIKQARKASGMSQRQLGIAAGLDPFMASTRINRYELGVHKPDYLTARRLACCLDVPVAFLYCDDDELAEMLLMLHRLPEAVRRDALQKIEDLSDDDEPPPGAADDLPAIR
ncbi:helix-turn-helix domain-containing protein [Aquabacterium sp. A7-Y]|uniref:helix-turn-helix domain-containing protein n=1 Tax=Aquabacterium sp. A7-Y TaxID=1349605 RepID=UPI00223CC9BC|nr:helix-turn-helix transcriptional regulator [Aquabacterium sp. A7-Y]MCW7537375.1 helix-turn-helix domain-containing protein [Aquabacterium sp. A7-Y]